MKKLAEPEPEPERKVSNLKGRKRVPKRGLLTLLAGWKKEEEKINSNFRNESPNGKMGLKMKPVFFPPEEFFESLSRKCI